MSQAEKQAIAQSPNNDEQLKREFWLGSTDGKGERLLDLLILPSLNVRGMASSRIGEKASNVIPATASATIDMRLVKGIDKRVAVERLEAHIRKQGYFVVRTEPDEQTRLSHARVAKVVVDGAGYNAARTSMDLPISKAVIAAVESARGPLIKLPSAGFEHAVVHDPGGAWVAHDHRADRQPRRQSAQFQRESPDRKPVGWNRNVCRLDEHVNGEHVNGGLQRLSGRTN